VCERAMKVKVHIRGCVFFGMAFCILSAIPVSAKVYQYRDKNGQLHFTNALSGIPEDQQPQDLMKQLEKPAETKGTENNAPEKNPPAIGKTTDPSKETPQSEDPGKPKKIPIVEDLNKEKAALDDIHRRLMKRKKELKAEKETLKTPEQVREYRKKVTRLNKEIEVYKNRNKAFQKKADAYNAAAREKGEE
jgi:hypothetical protein